MASPNTLIMVAGTTSGLMKGPVEDPEDSEKNLTSTKTIIKAFVTQHDAETLALVSKGRGISRAELCGEVLTKYLAGTLTRSPAQSTQVPNEGLSRALEESQRDREKLQIKVEMLESSITDRDREVSDYRGLLVETQRNLSAALTKIPAIPEATDHKPRWWEFWKGKG